MNTIIFTLAAYLSGNSALFTLEMALTKFKAPKIQIFERVSYKFNDIYKKTILVALIDTYSLVSNMWDWDLIPKIKMGTFFNQKFDNSILLEYL